MSDQLDLALVGTCFFDLFFSDLSDACCRDLCWRHIMIEHESHQDGQLVCCVDTFNVCSRICFCKAQSLCIFQSFVIAPAFFCHHVKDIVSSSVEDTHNFFEFVSSQRACQCSQDRDAAAYAGFELEDDVVSFSCFHQLVIVGSYSSLVGSNHVLAVFHSLQHE